MQHINFIDRPDALESLCDELKHHDWVALDTEFIRETTYYPQLCLIQVASQDLVACIDPLAIRELGPLMEIIHAPGIIKVLHSASQDMEIFYHREGRVPTPLFDTQVAACLLGHGDQIGYGNLVQSMLGITLDKAFTRTNWAQRPLDDRQLDYAADDVRFLSKLYPLLRETLTASRRLEWLEEDFARLQDPAIYTPAPELAWQRVNGISLLKSRKALAVVRALAAWREEEAMRADRPRRWILGDDVIIDLARKPATSIQDLSQIRGLPPKTLARHGQRLVEVIAEGMDCPPDQAPILRQRSKLDPKDVARIDEAMEILREIALKEDLNPSVLASRKDVQCLMESDTDCRLMRGWRRRMAGDAIRRWLADQHRP